MSVLNSVLTIVLNIFTMAFHLTALIFINLHLWFSILFLLFAYLYLPWSHLITFLLVLINFSQLPVNFLQTNFIQFLLNIDLLLLNLYNLLLDINSLIINICWIFRPILAILISLRRLSQVLIAQLKWDLLVLKLKLFFNFRILERGTHDLSLFRIHFWLTLSDSLKTKVLRINFGLVRKVVPAVMLWALIQRQLKLVDLLISRIVAYLEHFGFKISVCKALLVEQDNIFDILICIWFF